MEDFLNRLWRTLKSYKARGLILFFLVLLALLGLVALLSEIGFGDEVKKFRYIILGIVSVVALICVVVWLFVHLTNDQLNQKDEQIIHLRETIVNLIQGVTSGRVIGAVKVQFYSEKIYLEFKPRSGLNLRVGDEVRVVDKVQGDVMGVFEITHVNAKVCNARSGTYVSPLWLGYVRLTGLTETSLPPDSMAIHYGKDGE